MDDKKHKRKEMLSDVIAFKVDIGSLVCTYRTVINDSTIREVLNDMSNKLKKLK